MVKREIIQEKNMVLHILEMVQREITQQERTWSFPPLKWFNMNLYNQRRTWSFPSLKWFNVKLYNQRRMWSFPSGGSAALLFAECRHLLM